ncbi:MAG: HAD family hydrolase [Clostridia bacterium]
MIRAAIFDVDGTLLDSMPIWENAAAIYLKKRGIEAEAGLGRKLYSMSMQEGAAYLQEQYGVPLPASAIIEGVGAVVSEFYLREAPLKPHVKSFLSGLKEKGIPMAVATSNERPAVEAAFRRLALSEYFVEIFTCSEIGAGKTQPEIFLRAADTLRAEPRCTWVFEDAFYAARTARAAGFRVAGVYDASGEEDIERLKEQSDLYLATFSGFEDFYQKAQQEEFL